MNIQSIYRGVPKKSGFTERHFRYIALSPAVILLLLIGAFPVGYNLVLSLQNQTMLNPDTSEQLITVAAPINSANSVPAGRSWKLADNTVTL